MISMSEENALTVLKPVDLSGGSLFFNVDKFTHAQRVAKCLGASTMVPEHYRGEGNIGNVLIALNFAERTNLDPFMVMQNLYVVHGRPGIEAKLAIALVNNTGRFSSLDWRMEGEGKTRKATCFATRKDTGKEVAASCDMDTAEKEGWVGKSGSKWKTMPDMMLQYRSATFFARLFCPEALLGLQTKEEIFDAPVQVFEDTPAAPTASQKMRAARKAPESPAEAPAPAPNPREDWFMCAAAKREISPDTPDAALCSNCPLPNAPDACEHFKS
jgi:hypothetical protein